MPKGAVFSFLFLYSGLVHPNARAAWYYTGVPNNSTQKACWLELHQYAGQQRPPEDDGLVLVLELPHRLAFLRCPIQQLLQLWMELLEALVLLGEGEVHISIRPRGHDVELGVKHIDALRHSSSSTRCHSHMCQHLTCHHRTELLVSTCPRVKEKGNEEKQEAEANAEAEEGCDEVEQRRPCCAKVECLAHRPIKLMHDMSCATRLVVRQKT